MSFFDDTSNFGKVLTIAGLIMALASLAGSIYAADESEWHFAITSVGTLIYGLMIAGVGRRITSGAIGRKIDMVGSFVAVVGAGFIVQGFFSMIAAAVMGAAEGEAGAGIIFFVIALAIGLITIYIARSMVDGKATTLDRVFWFLLLVIFAIMFVSSLIGIFTSGGGITGILVAIANLFLMLVYAFLVMLLLSDDVKAEMGMA